MTITNKQNGPFTPELDNLIKHLREFKNANSGKSATSRRQELMESRVQELIEAGVSPAVADLQTRVPKVAPVQPVTKAKSWLEPAKFIHQGPIVDVARISVDNIRPKLVAAVYSPFMDDKGIHLRSLKSDFEQQTTYGAEVDRHLRMFSQEYISRGSVSVILLGQKGSGKTMTGEALCNYLLKDGLPVIYMDADIPGPILHNLIRDIGKCVLFIDEFDKRYQENNDKERLLTMFSDASLDGVSFIIAGNEKYRFSDFLLDRPSRFKYLIQFKGISPYIVEEICAKHKLTKECSSLIMRYACAHQASFDVVSAVVQLAAKVNSDIGQLIEQSCYMNVPKFSEFTVNLVHVRSEQGMVSGVTIKQGPSGYDLTVIHEDGAKVDLHLAEITNDAMVERSFTIGTFKFIFRIADNRYEVEDSLAATKRFTLEDVSRVTIDPGSYKTFELKKDDGEVEVVSRNEYQKKTGNRPSRTPWNIAPSDL